MENTIFKKDTKGNLRFLTIKTDGPALYQISGIVGTDKPIQHQKVCKGKNIGKSNQSTASQQAELEAAAMLTIKLSEDYYATEAEAMNGEKIFPMLANSYDKQGHKVDWERDVYLQPKLDGMRNLYVRKNYASKMMSRDGKEIVTMNHIKDELDEILKDISDIILDGELYAHGLNFQENMRLIKKQRPESVQIKFHVYDIVSDKKFSKRNKMITALNLTIGLFTTEVHTEKVTLDNVEERHIALVQAGFEGTMIRHGNDGYKLNGRSSSLLKKKDFDDIALPIIDIEPAEQRPEWGIPVFELNGKRFNSGLRMTHDQRVDLLANKEKYIGKTAEVRYFGVSEEGIPRFPVFVGFRLDK